MLSILKDYFQLVRYIWCDSNNVEKCISVHFLAPLSVSRKVSGYFLLSITNQTSTNMKGRLFWWPKLKLRWKLSLHPNWNSIIVQPTVVAVPYTTSLTKQKLFLYTVWLVSSKSWSIRQLICLVKTKTGQTTQTLFPPMFVVYVIL